MTDDDFDRGVLAGILIGEGHFGGDGRQPHVTLRMHIRHAALFRWIDRTFPGGKLYGPYNHGGRHYMQWMARGAFLRQKLLPLLESVLSPDLDGHSWQRFSEMRSMYARQLGVPGRSGPDSPDVDSGSPSPKPRPRTAEEIFAELRDEPGEGDSHPISAQFLGQEP